MTWNVSRPFSEGELEGLAEIDTSDRSGSKWTRLDAESTGITNLAQVARRTDEQNTVFGAPPFARIANGPCACASAIATAFVRISMDASSTRETTATVVATIAISARSGFSTKCGCRSRRATTTFVSPCRKTSADGASWAVSMSSTVVAIVP